MNLKAIKFILLLLASPLCIWSQSGDYQYQREVAGVKNQWHSIILLDDMFGKLKEDQSDIRIYGVDGNSDTLEVPYIWRHFTETIQNEEIAFQVINRTEGSDGYYFTLALDDAQSINQIILDFAEENYDWSLQVEASHDQQAWFTLLDKYRILSIKNQWTDYNFNKLSFASSNYRYYRVRIPSPQPPTLVQASVSKRTVIPGQYAQYNIREFEVNDLREDHQTAVEFTLDHAVPVSYLKVHIMDDIDYYRRFTLQYVADSMKSANGWYYHYRSITTGTLSSLEDNIFSFEAQVAKKFRLLVYNQDDLSLTISSFTVAGAKHQLAARFPQAERYFLVYGNPNADRPEYDLVRFRKNIPDDITQLSLGEAESLPGVKTDSVLIQNKLWLWVVMISLILLLGWFSAKMLRS